MFFGGSVCLSVGWQVFLCVFKLAIIFSCFVVVRISGRCTDGVISSVASVPCVCTIITSLSPARYPYASFIFCYSFGRFQSDNSLCEILFILFSFSQFVRKRQRKSTSALADDASSPCSGSFCLPI